MTTETITASELRERVLDRIWQTREPDAMPKYRKALAKYKKRLGRRKEVEMDIKHGPFSAFTRRGRGFYYIDRNGVGFRVVRPEKPSPLAYQHWEYDRALGTSARNVGFLSDAKHNREIRPQRVAEYSDAMESGRWRDLLSDPITITDDGQVINGQHRLAAASQVDWSEVPNDPLFLVVWGVAPEEAAHADLARRTDRDQVIIAAKLATEKA
jgi:hypothetical protein